MTEIHPLEVDDRDRPVEQVPPEDVLREWVRHEQSVEDIDEVDLDDRSVEELAELLEDPQRLAESVFLERDLAWYRLTLTEAELRGLVVVEGPDGEGWRGVAGDNDVRSVAERIASADDVESLNEDVPKGVTDVRELADGHDFGDETGAFVVVQESTDDPAYLADRNHRAVAVACHSLLGGGYEAQSAHVGVSPGEESTSLVGDDRAEDHPADW
ncbi:hypothetical protein [Halomarina litorea]|uniref:hypothetical protein n=1 Tax=Halomarina litorea TaxID=2961595 RepID=UPI0020C43749|nr:hypothetical protein [Halomarina sp. BCD28]